MPGATETVVLLVDGEVGEAGLGQLHPAEDPRHPGTDDGEPEVAISLAWLHGCTLSERRSGQLADPAEWAEQAAG